MVLPELQYITKEEYLETERVALIKHEYYQGEIFTRSGASLPHNIIFRNTFCTLYNKLKGKKCQPFSSDLRVHIPKNSLFTYPDITIICGTPETLDENFDTITNPSVIIEILSKSTRDYDKGQKFTMYRDISTLKEYILIDSEGIRVEKFTRNNDETWLFREYKSLEDTCDIDAIGEQIPLSEIYFEVLS
jgi:Uma2 family endonuclease